MGWRERNAGVEGEVSYPYFIGDILNPGSEGWHVGLEVLDLGVAWVVVEGGDDCPCAHHLPLPFPVSTCTPP